MDILFLLVPLSVLLVLALLGLFAWALGAQQFDDLEREGERILAAESDSATVVQPTKAPDQSGRA